MHTGMRDWKIIQGKKMNGDREPRKSQSGQGVRTRNYEDRKQAHGGCSRVWTFLELSAQTRWVYRSKKPTRQRKESEETFSKSEVWHAIFLHVTEGNMKISFRTYEIKVVLWVPFTYWMFLSSCFVNMRCAAPASQSGLCVEVTCSTCIRLMCPLELKWRHCFKKIAFESSPTCEDLSIKKKQVQLSFI